MINKLFLLNIQNKAFTHNYASGASRPENRPNIAEISFQTNPFLNLVSAADFSNRASVVPFTGKSFEQTLNENYFKLPAGAEPDIFQTVSANFLYGGNDVLVTAPTGTGKTAIALYAITKNLEEGKKTFYTTPLKALSNEKFRNFQKLFGEANVGLITGDIKVNKDAPIIIMTTEVYRNMIFNERFKEHNPVLDNLKTVVFDELHYLGDIDRGGVWEQSILLSDPHTQLLSLSATIGNNEEMAGWMSKARGLGLVKNYLPKNPKVQVIRPEKFVGLVDVPSENRHVPLRFNNLLLSGNQIVQAKPKRDKSGNIIAEIRTPVPQYADYQRLARMLQCEDKLPAIIFVFNKKNSSAILEHLARFGDRLTTKEEVDRIKDIVERYKSEGKYLGETLNYKALYKGYAIHNAGMLPVQKELIEELFQKKLVKLAIATETLSAGINMPARTTVISSYMKPSSNPDAIGGKRELMPNEFHQMAGRAGRRGIDKIGYCYTMSLDAGQKAEFDKLIASKPNALKSAFHTDYSFVAGYYDSCSSDDFIKEIAQKSFYTYDKNESAAQNKTKEFLKDFGIKRKVLRKFDYLDSSHNLSVKGKLLTKLNGYEQIPVIEAITSRHLRGMSPIELAAAAGTLANIKVKYVPKVQDTDKKAKPQFSHPNAKLDYFVLRGNNYLQKYNSDMLKIDSGFREVEFDTKAVNHIYDWAKLNSENENSAENWAKLMKNSEANPIRDEGTLFKEITMTVDLLKQICGIAKEGTLLASNPVEAAYYRELRETSQEAVKLLSRTPVCA